MESIPVTRSQFLGRAAGAILGGAIPGSWAVAQAPAPLRGWKGKASSAVKRWDVITIGNLSRNRYWGEGDEKGVRSAICTCTLITGRDFRLLVDPSLGEQAQMERELDRRAGLKPKDISAIFVTHEHADHYAGIRHFPAARWMAAAPVAEILNRSAKLPGKVESAAGELFGGVAVIATPGHTHGHHSLRFDCEGLSIVVAGDAVATRDFFRERRGYFNAVDFERSARTMDQLKETADIIVPGHDNYFLADVT